MKDKIINLGNNNHYLVIEEEKYKEHTYALAIKVDNKTGKMFKYNTIVVEEKNVNGNLVLDKIQEKELEKNMALFLLKKASI